MTRLRRCCFVVAGILLVARLVALAAPLPPNAGVRATLRNAVAQRKAGNLEGARRALAAAIADEHFSPGSSLGAKAFNDKGVVEMNLGLQLLEDALSSFDNGLRHHADGTPAHAKLQRNRDALLAYLEEGSDNSDGDSDNGVGNGSAQQRVDAEQDYDEDEDQYIFGPWVHNPEIKRKAREAFGLNRPIHITHCFTEAFAAKLHREMFDDMRDVFTLVRGETPFYQYHFDAVYLDSHPSGTAPMLEVAKARLGSLAMLDWVSDVSNSQIVRVSAGASRYKPGDYTGVHTDVKEYPEDRTRRRVAYIVHLTRAWKPEWGGDLVWSNPSFHILPTYNSITLFPVTMGSFHHVSPVSAAAAYPAHQRLAVSGWFMAKTSASTEFAEKLGANKDEENSYWAVDGMTGKSTPIHIKMDLQELPGLYPSPDKAVQAGGDAGAAGAAAGKRRRRRKGKRRKAGGSQRAIDL